MKQHGLYTSSDMVVSPFARFFVWLLAADVADVVVVVVVVVLSLLLVLLLLLVPCPTVSVAASGFRAVVVGK